MSNDKEQKPIQQRPQTTEKLSAQVEKVNGQVPKMENPPSPPPTKKED